MIFISIILIKNKYMNIGHGMLEINKKWLVTAFFDKVHSPLGKIGGKLCLVFSGYSRIDDIFIFIQWKVGKSIRPLRMKRPHVVGIGNTIKFIKAMTGRKKLLLEAQVPLAINGGGIAFLL